MYSLSSVHEFQKNTKQHDTQTDMLNMKTESLSCFDSSTLQIYFKRHKDKDQSVEDGPQLKELPKSILKDETKVEFETALINPSRSVSDDTHSKESFHNNFSMLSNAQCAAFYEKNQKTVNHSEKFKPVSSTNFQKSLENCFPQSLFNTSVDAFMSYKKLGYNPDYSYISYMNILRWNMMNSLLNAYCYSFQRFLISSLINSTNVVPRNNFFVHYIPDIHKTEETFLLASSSTSNKSVDIRSLRKFNNTGLLSQRSYLEFENRFCDLTRRLPRTRQNENRVYECNICLKRFKQRGNLNVHMRRHTGEKPFKCTVCAKRFRQLSHLRQHDLVHTGEKPHKCLFCAKCFSTFSNMKVHLKLHN